MGDRSDSQDVAEYYAARRGIPTDQLLGVAVTDRQGKTDAITYPDFFRRVLVPPVSDWPSWLGATSSRVTRCLWSSTRTLPGSKAGAPFDSPLTSTFPRAHRYDQHHHAGVERDPAPAVYFPAGEPIESSGGRRVEVLMLASLNTLGAFARRRIPPG